MRFVLEIDCDRLPEGDLRGDIAEILDGVADQIAVDGYGPLSGRLSCGSWRFIATPAHDPDGVSA